MTGNNLIAIAVGVVAAVIAALVMYRFVLPMALMELKRKAEFEGRTVRKEEEDRVRFNFRFIVPAGLLASFTISSLYMIGDVQ